MKQAQLFPSKTRDAKTRRDPARFVRQICPICSRGLDCVSLAAIFGRWCSDELLFHGRKSLSKILKGHQHFSTTSWQYWWTHGARSGNSDKRCFLPPAVGWHEHQIFNPTQCVYTTQHNATQHDAYCPASWHRQRTKGDVPSASLVEQLKGNYEQGVRGTQDRLKGQKLLEGDQPVWRRQRIWWQSLHHQMSSF